VDSPSREGLCPTHHHVDISIMPGYVEAALHKFQHPLPTKPEDSPHHAWNVPNYGTKVQYAPKTDTTVSKLLPNQVTRIQNVGGIRASSWWRLLQTSNKGDKIIFLWVVGNWKGVTRGLMMWCFK
jgi:hypothetical protein